MSVLAACMSVYHIRSWCPWSQKKVTGPLEWKWDTVVAAVGCSAEQWQLVWYRKWKGLQRMRLMMKACVMQGYAQGDWPLSFR